MNIDNYDEIRTKLENKQKIQKCILIKERELFQSLEWAIELEYKTKTTKYLKDEE